MSSPLRQAAEAGDINMLYRIIPHDPYLLEDIDKMPFADTPLHIAAERGHTIFAIEIMRLKPTFSRKPNNHGFSPIHVALKNQHYITVRNFIRIDKELVRVKGREGLTPLHFVTQIGELDLLTEFLSVCPDSIEDVTVKNETALHIAVKNRQLEALKFLLGWLQRNCHRGLEYSIINWKDDEGNTILHISASLNYLEPVKLLINKNINLNAKNFKNSTTLDIVPENQQDQVAEIKDVLSGAGALRGSTIQSNPSLADALRSKITVFEKIAIRFGLYTRSITEEIRNALLVVAVLIATATYQAALSPPGGVYQADDNHAGKRGKMGKVVMGEGRFLIFWLSNTATFVISTFIIIILLPKRFISTLLACSLLGFLFCYFSSMMVISPNDAISKANYILLYIIGIVHIAGTIRHVIRMLKYLLFE